MELSPPRSIPSSPIENLANKRKKIMAEIKKIDKDIADFTNRIKDKTYTEETHDFYSMILKFSTNQRQINIDLLNKINTEISNANKISPPNKKKRSRSNGGTKKKTRRNRRKSVGRRH